LSKDRALTRSARSSANAVQFDTAEKREMTPPHPIGKREGMWEGVEEHFAQKGSRA